MHPALSDRFLTPVILQTLELVHSGTDVSSVSLGEAGCEVVAEAIAGALGDPDERNAELEFESLFNSTPSRETRIWRAQLAYLLYRAQLVRRSQVTDILRRAEDMVVQRLRDVSVPTGRWMRTQKKELRKEKRRKKKAAKGSKTPATASSFGETPVSVAPVPPTVISERWSALVPYPLSDPSRLLTPQLELPRPGGDPPEKSKRRKPRKRVQKKSPPLTASVVGSTVKLKVRARRQSRRIREQAASVLTPAKAPTPLPIAEGSKKQTAPTPPATQVEEPKKRRRSKRKRQSKAESQPEPSSKQTTAKPAQQVEPHTPHTTASSPLSLPPDTPLDPPDLDETLGSVCSETQSPELPTPEDTYGPSPESSDESVEPDADSDFSPTQKKARLTKPRARTKRPPEGIDVEPADKPNSIPLAIKKKKGRRGVRALPLTAELLAQYGINIGADLPCPPQRERPAPPQRERPARRGDEGRVDGNASLPAISTQPAVDITAESDPVIQRRTRSRTKPEVAVEQSHSSVLAPIKVPRGATRSSTFIKVFRVLLGLHSPKKTTPIPKTSPPPTQPPVWAESRQELCEALPYYRAYQSGMYMLRRVAYGYLLDGFPAPRDVWAADGKVIISHGGGQAVHGLDANGNPIVSLSADHSPADARIDTLLRASATRVPIVLLAGQGYALLPWRLDCQYIVLGWYWVSAAWFEAEPAAPGMQPPGRDYFHRFKVRFDWVQSQGEPWWLRSGEGSWVPGVAEPESASIAPASNSPAMPVSLPKVPSSTLESPCSTLPTITTVTGADTPFTPLSIPSGIASSGSPGNKNRAERATGNTTPGLRTHTPATQVDAPTPPETPPRRSKEETEAAELLKCQKDVWRREVSFPTTYLDGGELVYPPNPHATVRPRQGALELGQQKQKRQAQTQQAQKQHAQEQSHNLVRELLDPATLAAHLAAHLAPQRLPTREEFRSPHCEKICGTCKRPSPWVYSEGWMCLAPTCSAFWMVAIDSQEDLGGHVPLLPVPPGLALTYSPAFLKHAPTPSSSYPPYDVVPPMGDGLAESTVARPSDGQSGTRSLWQGWVCTACGRANCRHRWELCECLGCGRQICALGEEHIVPASSLGKGGRDLLGEAKAGSPHLLTSVTWNADAGSGAMVVSYQLPSAGTVYHIKHTHSTHADGIWEAYQRAAISTPRDTPLFQRRALKNHTVKGSMLSQQFAINSGASYKYIVETLSYSFDESPRCVMDALDVIRSRVAAVLGTRVEFNEILSVMYREGQKMSWHDDGETGLGPVVSALSLGADAVMSFRPKTRKSGGVKHNAAPVLNLRLSHGDVVIMAGRKIQFMYDHRVLPSGLRVAATARVIGDQ